MSDLASRCASTFSALEKVDDKFLQVLERHPGCECEGCSVVPSVSPGKVEDNESVMRLIYCEQQIDRQGNLKPTAVDWLDTKGMSVNRIGHTERSDIEQRVADKLKESVEAGKKREFKGALVWSVEAVREVIYNNSRLFAVYDTALVDNRGHADIAWAQKVVKADRAEARDELLLLLGEQPKPQSLNDIFGVLAA